jgi:NlpC/P60 family putative phage cell wall peptidase
METETIVAAARGWLGTPYVHQASVKGAGCDCLGLLRGIWRELQGEDAETPPPYSPDWAEATGKETLHQALSRHLHEITVAQLRSGDIALFRMTARGPAKHCGIVAERNGTQTLIHARQNKCVSEEPFSAFWRGKLAYAFRLELTSPLWGGRSAARASGGGPALAANTAPHPELSPLRFETSDLPTRGR